ncbi:penicillin-binding transpeptidase domain-containing protein [Cytobacillus oceanisediminis]|uniref:penicillin-binding transpeptidase domain-containing protein n=1 Tax=Cytobacillus oceanisediminis TaxID=665099 RepID=UPI001D13B31A|nr:penicillin-binding transpeptidase domain-containing protein [Cytobacillus oceanisediminis]MCC3648528.1 penicillin-binding transpeptidase domain-containing protein [Cytobacillus oceanisediminis]
MKRVFFLFISLFILAFLGGCNKEIKPQDRFKQYVEHWNKQEFEKMYEFLSVDAKKSISKKEYVNRYEKVYKDLEISNLKVTYKPDMEKEYKKEEKAALPFSASMDSAAGKIEFTHDANLVKEEKEDEENWFVAWDTTYIFPELGPEDKITYSAVPSQRGDIVDRTGDPLALNGTLYEIGVVPEQMEGQKEQTIKGLSEALDISEEQINKTLNASWVQPGYFVPLKKVSPDDKDTLDKVFALKGVLKQDVKGRIYPFGEASAHLIGYVGPINADELKKQEGKGYSSTDLIGKRGLEQVLEERLKGTNGVKIGIEKKDGSEAVLAEKPVENGETIQLTIDITLQRDLYNEMEGSPGTAAAIDPVTGETLALVSSPSFDPNQASLGFSGEEWKALEENKDMPLMNRFKQTYAPGSVMKPITGAVGLLEGTLTLDETINVKGLKWQKSKSWGSYQVTRVKDPNAPVNFEKAMMYSDNIYFAKEALDLGKDKFSAGLKKFGFEEEMPYAFPMEPSQIGSLDSEIKLADSGYGQAEVEMNILHLAASYTPFINKGSLIKPVLMEEEEKNQVWKESIMSEDNAKTVESAMIKVVQDPSGTARSANMKDYPLAGKTGTAELKRSADEKGQENGLFVAYNPESPKLLMAMMIEGVEDKGGSKVVVEKVKKAFEKHKDRF